MSIDIIMPNHHLHPFRHREGAGTVMYTLPNLPPSIVRELFASLRESLPDPAIASPEARAAREDLAMAEIAALHPADAIEGELAVQVVAAGAWAKDCLRLPREYRNDLAETVRCRAQAMTMMRQMQTALGKLERRQATREKAEAEMHPAAMQRAGWWFREVSVPAEPTPPPEPEPAAPSQESALSPRPSSTPCSIPNAPRVSAPPTASRRPSTSARPSSRSSRPWSAATARSCRHSTTPRLSHPTKHNLANAHNETNPDTVLISPSPCGRGRGEGAPPPRPAITLSPIAGRA